MSVGAQALLYVMAAGIAFSVIIAQCRSGKPVRGFLKSGLSGICALAAVDIAGIFTGVSLGLNLFTLLVSLFLGLPGIVSVLLLNVVFA